MKKLNEFRRFYEEEGRFIRSDETNPDVVVRFKHMIFPILPRKSKKILDAGCGDGYLVSQLRKRGFDAFGIDISRTRINHAIKKYGKFYEIGSVYNLKFKEGTFDTVIASEVIEHLEQPDNAIEEFKRVSKKFIIFTFPYKEKLVLEACPHCLKRFYRSGHIQYFDWNRIAKMMERHDLKILKVKKVAYYPFINFPLLIALIINEFLSLLDKTTYIGLLCQKREANI